MNTVTMNVAADLSLPAFVPTIKVKQYDNNGRVLKVYLYNNGTVYTPGSSVKASIEGTKPDGCAIANDCSISGNVVSITITQQMTTASGLYKVDLLLIEGTTRIGKATFKLHVDNAAVQDMTLESTSEYLTLLNALNKANTLDARLNAIVASAGSGNTEIVDARVGADGTTYDTAGNAIRGQISELNETIIYDENCLSKALNISGNIFDQAEILSTNSYFYSKSGVLTEIEKTDFSAYRLKIEKNKEYSMTSGRFAVLLAGDKTTVLDYKENVTTINSGNAEYMIISFNHNTYPSASYVISKGAILTSTDTVNWTNASGIPELNRKIATLAAFDFNNLFHTGVLVAENAYYYNKSGTLTRVDAANFVTYCFPVDGSSSYTMTQARFAVLLASNKTTVMKGYDNLGSLTSSTIDSSGGVYLYVSFNVVKFPISSYIFAKGSALKSDTLTWTDTAKTAIRAVVSDSSSQNGFYVTRSDSMTAGSSIEFPINNVKKNNTYSFNAKITDFTSGLLVIGHGTTSYSSSYLSIDPTNITATTYMTSAASTTSTHGLTIADYIFVTIRVENNNTADVYIRTSSGEFSQADVPWYGDSAAKTFAKCTTGTLSNATFSWSCADLKNELWAFGDSYFGISVPSRWVYHLIANGYTNVMLNGFGGEATNNDLIALNNLLGIGKPSMLLWAVGMNDGTDNSSAPSQTWKTGVETVISICETNGIIPVFATTPTVPNINHEQKNAWVRSSGYRYIDFARAVGADGTGAWYSGMLSGDKVHPTESGAKALFRQAICDLPELTY